MIESGSASSLLPCSYNGTMIHHGNLLNEKFEDKCRTCSCDNSAVICGIRKCQRLFCDEPILPEGECCEICLKGKLYIYRGLNENESSVECRKVASVFLSFCTKTNFVLRFPMYFFVFDILVPPYKRYTVLFFRI